MSPRKKISQQCEMPSNLIDETPSRANVRLKFVPPDSVCLQSPVMPKNISSFCHDIAVMNNNFYPSLTHPWVKKKFSLCMLWHNFIFSLWKKVVLVLRGEILSVALCIRDLAHQYQYAGSSCTCRSPLQQQVYQSKQRNVEMMTSDLYWHLLLAHKDIPPKW